MNSVSTLKLIATITRQELKYLIEKSPHFYSDWACSCLVCSWLLTKVYKRFGIKAKLVIGFFDFDYHAYVLCGNKIVDITATQFDKKSIHIVSAKNQHYRANKIGREARSEIKYWPKGQKPSHYRKDLSAIYASIVSKIESLAY